jgi:hypothetical protein
LNRKKKKMMKMKKKMKKRRRKKEKTTNILVNLMNIMKMEILFLLNSKKRKRKIL